MFGGRETSGIGRGVASGAAAAEPSGPRFVLAMVLAPALTALVIGAFIFMIMSLSRDLAEAVPAALAATGRAALYIFGASATVGMGMTAVLRRFRLRNPFLWLATGAACGAMVAVAYAFVEGVPVSPALIGVCALIGWGQFLVLRWIAGLR